MLGKLIKYEIKAFGRVMLPLYGVLIAAAVVFSLTIRLSMNAFAKSILEKFAIITGTLFVAAIVAVMVVMVIMIIQRFYRNLLGTEGYLMFTLPVTTLQHILSKAICALIWIALGTVAGTVSGLIMIAVVGDLPEFSRQLQEALKILRADQDIVVNVILIMLTIIIGLMATLSKVYAAISIGHQWSDHRLMGAVLAYVGIGIFELIFTTIPGIRGIVSGNEAFRSFRQFSGLMIGVSAFQTVLYGAVAWLLLDRRLNLE